MTNQNLPALTMAMASAMATSGPSPTTGTRSGLCARTTQVRAIPNPDEDSSSSKETPHVATASSKRKYDDSGDDDSDDDCDVPYNEHFPQYSRELEVYSKWFQQRTGQPAIGTPIPMRINSPTASEYDKKTNALFLNYHPPKKTPSYVLRNGQGADHSMNVIESIVNSALPDEYKGLVLQQFLDGMFDLYDGCHAYKNRDGSSFCTWENYLKPMPPKVRKQWRSRKIKLIAKFISDEILVRKRVGMKCFVSGKIPCMLWPSILLAAREMAIEEVEAILRGMNAPDTEIKAAVGYDISFATTSNGILTSVPPKPNGKASKCGDNQVYHICLVRSPFMPMPQRIRMDDLATWFFEDLLPTDTIITYCQNNRSNIGTEAQRRIADSERTHNRACTAFNTLVRYGGDVLGLLFGEFDVRNDITDDLHRLAAGLGGMINLLGGKDDPVVEAILDATQDPEVIAEQLSAALSLEAEAQAADRWKRADAKRLESGEWAEILKRAEEKKAAKAEKLAADKLEMENNLAERASIKRDEEIERVATAKEAADKLAAGTNCTERASSSKNEQKWDDMFEVLVRYIEEIREMATRHMSEEQKAAWFWDGNVPNSYRTPCGKTLGVWIATQRSAKAKDTLKTDRGVRLTSTGLRWRMI